MAIRYLPTIRRREDLIPYLKRWERAVAPLLRAPRPAKVPWNLRVTSKRNGILIEWDAIVGADGYEVQRSDDGSFTDSGTITIPITNRLQNSHFDALGGVSVARTYRIRSTAGTDSRPYSVKGVWSFSVTETSIDSTDVVTPENTSYDLFTDDFTQRRTRLGYY
jgi:hypothetical protein